MREDDNNLAATHLNVSDVVVVFFRLLLLFFFSGGMDEEKHEEAKPLKKIEQTTQTLKQTSPGQARRYAEAFASTS